MRPRDLPTVVLSTLTTTPPSDIAPCNDYSLTINSNETPFTVHPRNYRCTRRASLPENTGTSSAAQGEGGLLPMTSSPAAHVITSIQPSAPERRRLHPNAADFTRTPADRSQPVLNRFQYAVAALQAHSRRHAPDKYENISM